MNKLKGFVRGIINDDDISIIEIMAEGVSLSAIRTKGGGSFAINIDDQVIVSFKETAMSIGKNLSGELSIQNRFDLIIRSLTVGKVLTKILVDFGAHHFVSVITTASAKRMQLRPGDLVQGLVKTTDMLFSKTDT